MELLELPLTREDYLNPRFGDKWVQGRPHGRAIVDLADRLERCFDSRPELVILVDVQHVLGRGLPKPSPDISVIRGARDPDRINSSYDMARQGVPPCLILEVISPQDARIREVDEIDKVQLYQRIKVPEYLLLELPREPSGRLRIFGYRLDSAGTYQEIVPDEQGRLLSETTGLWFSISPKGDQVVIREVATGELVPTSKEEEKARKRAEAKAAREAAARQAADEARQAAEAKAAAETEARHLAEEQAAAAETELARLRAEIERLRTGR
jgi:Uma2 family endonuclease